MPSKISNWIRTYVLTIWTIDSTAMSWIHKLICYGQSWTWVVIWFLFYHFIQQCWLKRLKRLKRKISLWKSLTLSYSTRKKNEKQMCETIGTQAFTNNLAFFFSISVFFSSIFLGVSNALKIVSKNCWVHRYKQARRMMRKLFRVYLSSRWI